MIMQASARLPLYDHCVSNSEINRCIIIMHILSKEISAYLRNPRFGLLDAYEYFLLLSKTSFVSCARVSLSHPLINQSTFVDSEFFRNILKPLHLLFVYILPARLYYKKYIMSSIGVKGTYLMSNHY